MARRYHRFGWGHLRNLIEESLEGDSGFGKRVEVDGKIHRISDGLWHDNYWFRVRSRHENAVESDEAFILRLLQERYDWQKGDEPRDRLVREAETLKVLKRTDFPYPTPEFICFVEDDENGPFGMIETALPGLSLGDVEDRTSLKLIARVAAAVHALPAEEFSHLPCSVHRTVATELEKLGDAVFDEFPETREVREWIETHSPSGGDTCVLHGDLLPQNLLYELRTLGSDDALVGVVDWEMARFGEPAYDFAIVSRGNRKVLGVNNGLRVLVEEYLDSGGKPVSVRDVHVYELLLVLSWLEDSWREYQGPEPSGHGPDFYKDKLRSLFRRVAK